MQAILCRLAGLEEYATIDGMGDKNSYLSETLTGKVLVAEVLQTPEESSVEDPTITVILFDTSTNDDVNLNKEILIRMSQLARSPKLTTVCRIILSILFISWRSIIINESMRKRLGFFKLHHI